MKLVVGLGNPGKKYQFSRHNVGFMLVNHLAQDKSWSQSKNGLLSYAWLRLMKEEEDSTDRCKVQLVKPQTYMNLSGQALAYLKKKYSDLSSEEIYVIHDDLDLELGNYKFQLGVGPKEHNGLLSIYQALGTDQFWHIRVGVDGRAGQRKIPAKNYVLHEFNREEKPIIDQTIEKVAQQLKKKIIQD